MLFALRSGTFPRDVIPSFVATLKAVVKANFSTEVVRALATFVTSFSQRGNTKERKTTISRGSSSPVKKAFSEELDVPKVARKISGARDPANYEVVVLEMLVDILLSPERRYINKFATTITSKVGTLSYGTDISVGSSSDVYWKSRPYYSRSQNPCAPVSHPRYRLRLQILCSCTWLSGSSK